MLRVYDENGHAVADMIALREEEIDFSKPVSYIDEKKPWKKHRFENCTAKELQVPVYLDGKLVYQNESIPDIANYVKAQLDHEIWSEEQRFENPHTHYIDMSKKLYETKMELLNQARGEN